MAFGIFNKKSAADLNTQGLTHFKNGKYDDAIRDFDKAIESDPQYAAAWCNKAVVLTKQSKRDEAIKAIDLAIKANPQFALAWVLKGNAISELGKPDEAIQAYDEAIQVNPQFAMAWNNKSVVFRNQGKYDEALQLVNKAIELLGPESVADSAVIQHNKREIEKKLGTFKDEPIAKKMSTGIVDNCLRIIVDGKMTNYPISQVKLISITDTSLSIKVTGSILPKTFFFTKENKGIFEHIADALPSDIWYRDATAQIHVASYSNEKEANKEANLAVQRGWMPQGSSTVDGHYNIGAGLGSAMLLGPIGLLAAGNRTGGKITITYVRTPEWLASQGRV